MVSDRISNDELYMAVASIVSTRSTCPRRAVGAVIVKDNIIISTGYNGAPANQPHCTDVGCHTDSTGSCRRAVHAETNAIMRAATLSPDTLYTTTAPCASCAAVIASTSIKRVVYVSDYRNIPGVPCGTHILVGFGIVTKQLESDTVLHVFNRAIEVLERVN